MHPRQSTTTHTEQLGAEAAVYDWVRGQVHALNPTAPRVWRLCDGATSPNAMAAALDREMVPDAEAVVELTLRDLARLHLLEHPVESCPERPAPRRRWLLGHGVAAAMLPAIHSIAAPSPVEAQSPGPQPRPTLTAIAPNQGIAGTTVAVTLTGTNFVVGATTVAVAGGGVSVTNVAVSSTTSLTANFVLDAAAALGARAVTVTTPGGTSDGQNFTITAPAPGAPTLTTIAPNQGTQGTTVAVTLTGTNFVVDATTVAIAGGGVSVTTVVVSSTNIVDRQLRARSGGGRGRPQRDGHDRWRHQRWTKLHDHCAGADADDHRAESARPGQHGGRHADGHQFRRRRHDGECQRYRRDGQRRRRREQHVADRQLRHRRNGAVWRPVRHRRDYAGWNQQRSDLFDQPVYDDVQFHRRPADLHRAGGHHRSDDKLLDGATVTIELHHELMGRTPFVEPRGYDDLVGRSQPFKWGGMSCRTLSCEDMLWHAYAHAFVINTLRPGAIRLLSIADLVHATETWIDRIDWTRLRRQYGRLSRALHVADNLVPWSPHVAAVLREQAGRSGSAVRTYPIDSSPVWSAALIPDVVCPPEWWFRMRYGITAWPRWVWFRAVGHPARLAISVGRAVRARLPV
jgi:hypothetical protein